MNLPSFQSSKGATPDTEILQLKDFIARGEPPQWCVYVDDSSSYPYSNYQAALDKFTEIPPGFGVSLVLWTRIGTQVTFKRREA